jgi:hypothetical protein
VTRGGANDGFDHVKIENNCDLPDEFFVLVMGSNYYTSDVVKIGGRSSEITSDSSDWRRWA